MNIKPKVSIGLPVYNGENFIREAIESILAQTFTDFELIISDNASTDQTETICRYYEDKDKRIKYFRNAQNIGASQNYTKVFEPSSGKYFKWAAHDDICQPKFLEKCVDILDKEPSVVLCYPRAISIDTHGNQIKEWPTRPAFYSSSPLERYKEVFEPLETFPIWGLMRRDILRQTPLLGEYTSHDKPLLGELSLHGKFYEIPDFLFFSREHPKRSVREFDYRNPYQAIAWYAPDKADKLTFPSWRLLVEQLAAISRPPLKIQDRLACYWYLIGWGNQHRMDLLRDVEHSTEYLPIFGDSFKALRKRKKEFGWQQQIDVISSHISSMIPQGDCFILADENSLNKSALSQWKTLPFLEKDGVYWGLPPDDETAIQELQRSQSLGARFFVLVWSSFWWLEHYTGFFQYLDENFILSMSNEKIIIYSLQNRKEY